MLVAYLTPDDSECEAARGTGHVRCEAKTAQRSGRFVCPDCGGRVILRRGRINVAHFAHWRAERCEGQRGETFAHLKAKQAIVDALRFRDVRADLEYSGPFAPKGRRADILVHPPGEGAPVVIEIQHSSLPLDELEARARDYADFGLAQMWIPFLSRNVIESAERVADNRLRGERYSPRQYELWIHSLYRHEGCWMIEPESGRLWRAGLSPGRLRTKEAIWYEMGAVKHYRPAGEKPSKRFRVIDLEGPFRIEDLRIRTMWREASGTTQGSWPAGRVAEFIPK